MEEERSLDGGRIELGLRYNRVRTEEEQSQNVGIRTGLEQKQNEGKTQV